MHSFTLLVIQKARRLLRSQLEAYITNRYTISYVESIIMGILEVEYVVLAEIIMFIVK
jgi:hypothetical protein